MYFGKGTCFLLKYIINIAYCKGEICIGSFGNKEVVHHQREVYGKRRFHLGKMENLQETKPVELKIKSYLFPEA